MTQRSNEWYSEGLRFACTKCGACCTGPPGYVSFTPDEAVQIAAQLGVEVEVFLRDYAHKGSNGWSLNEVETEQGFDCVFLDRTTTPGEALCSLYDARPAQCRTWPWWPENLKDRRAWDRTARHCEGIGQGELIPIEAIRIQRNETPS